MPSLSPSLERALHGAVKLASERQHEYATVEHLLLALVDDADADLVMRACNVDLDALRTTLTKYVEEDLATLTIEAGQDAKPTTGFQRVVQRAVLQDGTKSPAPTCSSHCSPSANPMPCTFFNSRT